MSMSVAILCAVVPLPPSPKHTWCCGPMLLWANAVVVAVDWSCGCCCGGLKHVWHVWYAPAAGGHLELKSPDRMPVAPGVLLQATNFQCFVGHEALAQLFVGGCGGDWHVCVGY